VVQKISLLEITSTCSAAASCGCRSSGVFYAIDSATLQPVHRCTPAPYGMLAVPAALPTDSSFALMEGSELFLCHCDISWESMVTDGLGAGGVGMDNQKNR